MSKTTETAKPEPEKVPAELVQRAKDLCNAMKMKYKEKTGISNSLDTAADYAFQVWLKAAKANPRTGAAQIENDGPMPAIEKYFVRKLMSK